MLGEGIYTGRGDFWRGGGRFARRGGSFQHGPCETKSLAKKERRELPSEDTDSS